MIQFLFLPQGDLRYEGVNNYMEDFSSINMSILHAQ
jgi:hypothetical protein